MTKSLEYIKKRRSPRRFINDYKLSDYEKTQILESIR